jgi:hypothetical protein
LVRNTLHDLGIEEILWLGEQVRENDISRACITTGGTREMHLRFWWGHVKQRDTLEVLEAEVTGI